MDRLTHGEVGRFTIELAEGRVSMDGKRDILDRGAHFDRQRAFADQVGGVRSHHVHADHPIVGLVRDDLEVSVARAECPGAARGSEGKARAVWFDTFGRGFLVGQADGRDFGVREDHGRYYLGSERGFLAGQGLGRDERFRGRLVGQGRAGGNIADRGDVRRHAPVAGYRD